jgi:hypothetical protein
MADRNVTINLSINLPEGFRFGLHESCRKNDPEPFCFTLTKELGSGYQHEAAFSSLSFEDAKNKAFEKFKTEKSLNYWSALKSGER